MKDSWAPTEINEKTDICGIISFWKLKLPEVKIKFFKKKKTLLDIEKYSKRLQFYLAIVEAGGQDNVFKILSEMFPNS